ncbi:NAD-dependent epimerase/dehydratase family protein [Gloeothece verrucosa]|uniref:NAD-dependent epimerase/dehydratase n=1 Tax=Gloeothece verrucosa (strain PCC 7822) TaxID=497965 RepID=E0UKV6_GLOV7|nr:NAD-dependent epimerase/dehydratase family protein [Gloeothece verrucosa]ADN17586.1 NAD-dependent epimerase/dehydratase [Gloeothece verrucosa PCC 7822]
MPNSRVLITGGAGFIGTHLAERLSQYTEVVLFDSFRRNSLSLIPSLKEHPKIKVISGDVLDPSSIRLALDGVDTVIHLAAIAGVSSYYQESLQTLRVNILGTSNLLEAAAKQKIKMFVHFSTSEIYGSNALWVDEESPYIIGSVSDRRWVYATSKLAGENFSLRYAEAFDFACTTVRPFNIYGPRQVGEGAISNFCRAISSGQPMKIYGDGSAIRAWCYISDLVDAVEMILKIPDAAGQAFNIGNPSAVATTLELAQQMAKIIPEATFKYEQVKRSEIKARIPSINKAQQLLGYEPKIGLETGLRRTFEWFKQQQEKRL